MKSNRKPIICVGLTPCIQRILSFPQVEKGRVNRALETTIGIGGKGANTARMVKQLGESSILVGFVGGDNGKVFEHLLDNEGIDYRHVRASGETRFCQTLVEDGSPETTELVEEMPPITSDEWSRLLDLIEPLDFMDAVLTLSGKLPAGAPLNGYAQLCKRAATAGAKIILDVPGEPLLKALENRPALVKINDVELLQTVGGNCVEEAARKLMGYGAKSVLITRGAKSAWYIDQEESIELLPPKIEAVNPVGSGDAVTAGIAVAWNAGMAKDEMLIEGMACGAANALNLISGFLRPEDVERLRHDVVLKPVGK